MTWSRFDDAAPKSPKAVAAGNEAWALWAAAVMYCNRHLTDGFVTLAALQTDCLPQPIAAKKARKLAEELCSAIARPDGAGLFERVGPNMYKVHDFLDWNPSKAEVEAKRKADRERKRGRADSSQAPTGEQQDSRRIPDGIPRGIPSGRRADSASHAGARARVPAQPAQPSQTFQETREGDPSLTGHPPGEPPSGTHKLPRHVSRFEDAFASLVPEDFAPDASNVELARSRGIDLEHERQKFVAHNLANRKTACDWQQDFRLWLLRCRDIGPRKIRGGPVQPSHGMTGFENAEVVGD